VTGDFGVCRCFTKGRNKELGPAMHGQKDTFRPATACARTIIWAQKLILNQGRWEDVMTTLELGR
jgi:hypothetical protein